MSENITFQGDIINIDNIVDIFKELTSNQDKLINGYKILSSFEKSKGFYIGILEIIFANLNDKMLTKLRCSSFNVFIKKNWIFEGYIEQSEKLVNSN